MAQKTVLIVEDEFELRRILIQTLDKEGYATLAASDGKEGLEIALNKKPDLILLDIMMPNNGLTMLENLRKDEEYGKGARVILLTNLSSDTSEIIHAIEKHEPVFYLVKANYSPEQVVDKVREALASSSEI